VKEMQLSEVGKGEAAFRLAKLRAQQILAASSDPLEHIRDFEHLWFECDYCEELQDYGNLDDDVYVARYMGKSEQEIRVWLIERLKKLAAA